MYAIRSYYEFALAAEVSRLMAKKGHPVSVAAQHDQVERNNFV